MSKKLLIVESPAKAKTIEKYLKDLGDYKVVASIGHVRDLPKKSEEAIDIKGGFIPKYVISPGKEKVINQIKDLSKKYNEVILATDPDREGEAIAWHIAKAVGLKNPKRVVFNEITKEAVEEAIKNPRKIDENLKQAQEARRVLDRLFGYDLSGLIWKKVRYGLSAGRVQSPALRILMEREREIRKFKPETYWTITALLEKNKNKNLFACTEEPRDKKLVDKILEQGKKGPWIVADNKETKAKRSPHAPFRTSTLQQVASTRLGFSPSRTMGAAQKLYESGHITYMRTDSTNISKQAIAQISKILGSNFVPRKFGKASASAQEAHEAIRPTNCAKTSAGITSDQKKLYELIRTRTISAFMPDAEIIRTKILVDVGDKSVPQFFINGQRIINPGWLSLDTRSRGEDTEVPKVSIGDEFKLIELNDEQKETLPPNRYTEAGLIKELEKRGIGRPSTYASIIKTLDDRGYTTKEGKTLFPTDTGDVVSTFIEDNFEKWISDSFTAEMENELDQIATGERDYTSTLKDFYKDFSKDIKSKENIDKLTTLGEADKKHKCPKCGSKMDIKLGKNGKFLSCSRFPDCDGSLTIDGKEINTDGRELGIDKKSGETIYVLDGRFGPYVQLGKKSDENETPRRASIPTNINPEEITISEAEKLLILPRELGPHPESGEQVISNIGRFGPYVGHGRDFRSIKKSESFDAYNITLEQALNLLNKPKQPPKGAEIAKVVGEHPKTKKEIVLYKSKQGFFLRKGLRRIYLPDNLDLNKFGIEEAVDYLKQ